MNKEDLLKIFKNKNNRLICLILIIGVVLMAVASVDKNKKADVQPTAAVTSVEDEEPMVVKEVYPKVRGVIVTADGGGNSAVRSAISEAVTASLDVPAHRICIFKKEVK